MSQLPASGTRGEAGGVGGNSSFGPGGGFGDPGEGVGAERWFEAVVAVGGQNVFVDHAAVAVGLQGKKGGVVAQERAGHGDWFAVVIFEEIGARAVMEVAGQPGGGFGEPRFDFPGAEAGFDELGPQQRNHVSDLSDGDACVHGDERHELNRYQSANLKRWAGVTVRDKC